MRFFARFLVANGVRSLWFPTVSLGLLAFCLVRAVPTSAQDTIPTSPTIRQGIAVPPSNVPDLPEEMRGLWVVRDSLVSPDAVHQDWADWRRAQITDLVAKISRKVKADKPWMQVSAAVFPDSKEAFAVRGQDWEGWLQNGYLDAVALMAYDRNTERVLEQTRHAIAIAGERQVYTGIGAWRLQAHDVAGKITALRQTGAAGVNLFSYGGVHNRPRYLDTLARGVFASRAAPPRMRWLPKRDSAPEKEKPLP